MHAESAKGRASEVSVLHSKLGQGVRVTRLLSAGDSNLHDIRGHSRSTGSRDAKSESAYSFSYQLGLLDKSCFLCLQFLHFRSQQPRDDSGVVRIQVLEGSLLL